MSEVLSKQPRPKGPRLTIVTNAGGPGVLATDTLISEGGELTEISEGTMQELNAFLPGAWSHNNPIDILGDADPERYAKALEIAARDPNSDGLLVILTPQAMTDPTQTAELLKNYANLGDKPVLASWMGGSMVAAGDKILNRANIPTFNYPDSAVRMFMYMWRYTHSLRALYETPMLPEDTYDETPDREAVHAIIEKARAQGRTILTETESKQVLAAYKIPTTPIEIATTADEAVKAANAIGYPVVVKIHSETITHKVDVGGVILNVKDAQAVRDAFNSIQTNVTQKASAADFLGVTVQPMVKLDGYEVIIGSSIDPQFGPVLLFGMGGSLVEVFKDRALGLPPLTTTLARRMMERTKIYEALKGVRGKASVDLVGLEKLMVRFSQLVIEQPWIKEMDINPLIASPERLLALDARVLLHPADTQEEDLPKPAIRPYPTQYIDRWTSTGGDELLIRPIRAEDEPLLVDFHERLSERTVYQRFFSVMKLSQRVAHERLSRISFIDYDRELALVATKPDEETGQPMMVGVGRLVKLTKGDSEFGLVVSDDYQRQGLGRELLKRLVDVGRDEKLNRIIGYILPDNTGMLHVAETLGFKLQPMREENLIKAVLDL